MSGYERSGEYEAGGFERLACSACGIDPLTSHPSEAELELYASQWNDPQSRSFQKSDYFKAVGFHFLSCSSCKETWHDLKVKYGIAKEHASLVDQLDLDEPLNNPNYPD